MEIGFLALFAGGFSFVVSKALTAAEFVSYTPPIHIRKCHARYRCIIHTDKKFKKP
jgi:hypothetical protein